MQYCDAKQQYKMKLKSNILYTILKKTILFQKN